MTQQITLPGIEKATVLRKHVGTVHSASPLTARERVAVNVLLANAMTYANVGEKISGSLRQHSIDINHFSKLLAGERLSRSRLEKVLNGLLKKTVHWNYVDEKLRERWGASSWLAGYEVVDNMIRYSYSVEIMSRILDPDVFARINYSIQHRLARRQSLALYENCARYRDIGRTRAWSLDTFRGLMGVEGRYPEFKTLNRDVIKPSVEEINEKTEIFIEPVLKKHGREVLAIQFVVEENTSYDGPPMPPLLGPNLDDDTISERLATYEALLTFGIDRGAAVSLLDQYDDQYIFDNLYVVSERIRNGKTKVHRPAAYAVNAIKQDYRPPDVDYDAINSLGSRPEKKKSKEDIDKQKIKAAREKLAEFNNTHFPAWRFRQWESAVTSNDYQQTWNRFRDEVLNTTPMLMKRYSSDPESPMVSAHFRTFVRTAVLDEPTRDDEVACAHDLDMPLADWLEQAKLDKTSDEK